MSDKIVDMNFGVKHDSEKERYDLIPAYPLQQMAKLYTFGAKKYSDRNWEKGLRWGRCLAALMRHTWAFWGGEDNDSETGLCHMTHAAFCCFSLIEFTHTRREFDDRPGSLNPQEITPPAHLFAGRSAFCECARVEGWYRKPGIFKFSKYAYCAHCHKPLQS